MSSSHPFLKWSSVFGISYIKRKFDELKDLKEIIAARGKAAIK